MGRSSGGFGSSILSEAVTAEFDAIGVVNDAIEDGIGQGGLGDFLVPTGRWSKKASGLEKLLFHQLNFNRLADGCIMYIKMLRYFLQGIAIRYMGL